MKARVVLEDGTVFEGVSVGAPGERIGEVVLNTAVVGYQEIMTDPSYAGTILVFTYPLLGNYGVAAKFNESGRCWAGAVAMKEISRIYSNWQAEDSLDNFLKKEGVIAAGGIDTRTLAVAIRDKGEMLGAVSDKATKKEDLLKAIRDYKKDPRRDFIKDISVKKPTHISGRAGSPRIGVLDLGMLNGFVAQLKALGCAVTFLPYDTPYDTILNADWDGLIISNGPEADEAIPGVTRTVKGLLGKIPLLGISTGHEVIGLALGGKLKRMKAGHRGVNYPVTPPRSLKGEITVQNHSYVIDENSIKNRRDVAVGLINLNDGSVEEMESAALKFISVQYYPVSPGFGEVNSVFKRFLALVNPSTHSSLKTGACSGLTLRGAFIPALKDGAWRRRVNKKERNAVYAKA